MMADPVSILSATASIASIINVLTKSINMATDLTVQWGESDLVFVSLKARLQVLVSALGKIQHWVESTILEEAHHQLIMDLESMIHCTKMLAAKLQDTLGDLQRKLLLNGTLSPSGKATLILRRRSLETIDKMIDRQASVLTLLLTACNSTIISEQTRLIEEPTTRKAIERVDHDSVSLVVHYGPDSGRASFTDNLSRLSVKFGFDNVLLGSGVYSRTWRNHIRLAFEHLRAKREIRASDQDLHDPIRPELNAKGFSSKDLGMLNQVYCMEKVELEMFSKTINQEECVW